MNFEAVFELLLKEFKKEKVDFALIGGFALAQAGYERATGDIDFLVDKEDLVKVKKIMAAYGYELLHESQDISNFLNKMKELGKVDFLLAYRKYTKTMLIKAEDKEILNGKFKVKVIRPEDLIGLKIQSSSNDPGRYYQDMADIEAVMRANYSTLDMKLIEEYFVLFDRKDELKQLLEKLKNA